MKFIKSFGEFNKVLLIPYEMTTSVRFCLSYDLLNAILSPSKFVYFNGKFALCHRCRQYVTGLHRKCYVTCGHNIIFDMTLSTE